MNRRFSIVSKFVICLLVSILIFGFQHSLAAEREVFLLDIDNNLIIDQNDADLIKKHIVAKKTGKHSEWILDDYTNANINDYLSMLRYNVAEKDIEMQQKHPDWSNLKKKIKLEISQNAITLNLVNNLTEKLEIFGENYGKAKFKTSDEEIVRVNDTGMVTAINEGEAIISVTDEEELVLEECKVTVESETIKMNSTEVILDMTGNNTKQLEVNGKIYGSITWTSSNEEVATVSKGGLVTGVSNGTCTIMAKTESGKTDSCDITVQTSPAGIVLNPTNAILDMSGTKTLQLAGAILPSTANINKKVMWESSNEEVATVSKGGLVTGVSNGTCTITVITENGKTANCNITVQTSLEKIEIATLPNKTIYNYGEELDLTGMIVTATYISGEKRNITGSVSVSGYNKTKLGTQTITVRYEGETVTFTVKVVDYVTKIEITTPPDKTIYYYEEELDITGMVLTATYASGEIKNVEGTIRISGYDKTMLGIQTVTVTYEENIATFMVKIIDYITKIEITSLPDKTTYEYGEAKLDTTGIIVTAVYASGATADITEECKFSGYENKPSQLSQTIKVIYQDSAMNKSFTTNFIVTTVMKNIGTTGRVVQGSITEYEQHKVLLEYDKEIDNGDYRVAQGFCKVGDYYLCAVYGNKYTTDDDGNTTGLTTSERDKLRTYLYILDADYNTVAVIGDRSYGHANSFTYDRDNNCIYTLYNDPKSTKRFLCKIKGTIISDALNKVQETGNILIKDGENTVLDYSELITEYELDRVGISTISYNPIDDGEFGALYGCAPSTSSNKSANATIYKLVLNDATKKVELTKCCEIDIDGNDSITDSNSSTGPVSGFIVHRNYIIVGKYLDNGVVDINGNSVRNFIDVYHVDVNSNNILSNQEYRGSYALNSMDELEDIEYVNASKLLIYVNKLYGRGYNYIYEITLDPAINLYNYKN